MERRRVSAPYREFINELDALTRLDADNQSRFSSSASRRQLILLSEGVFFSTFRVFERFLEDVFVLYTLEKPSISGLKYRSYLKPRNFSHGRELIQSSMPYLDWTSPDNVLSRSETYLVEGAPIKGAIVSSMDTLRDMKKIRNHIAHDSRESLIGYKAVITKHYKTIPLSIPRPGEYLLQMVPKSTPSKHYLVHYIENIKTVGNMVAK